MADGVSCPPIPGVSTGPLGRRTLPQAADSDPWAERRRACCSSVTTGQKMCDARPHVASELVDWRTDDVGDVAPGPCSRPVPALTCVAGNRGVRSSGKKPKQALFRPGCAGEGKTG